MMRQVKRLSVILALVLIVVSTFPVTLQGSSASADEEVDPTPEIKTIVLQNGLNGYDGSKDVSTIREYPLTHPSVWMGYYGEGMKPGMRIWDDGEFPTNGLIYFDVSQIPAASEIISAKLQLYGYWGTLSPGIIDLYRITDDDNKGMWGEGDNISEYKTSGAAFLKRNGSAPDYSDAVGWTNTYGSTILDSVNTIGGSPAATGSMDIGNTPADAWYYSSDLKDDVQAWVSGAAVNQGWYVKARNGTGVYIAFASNQCENNPEVPGDKISYRPKLEITYREGTGPIVTPSPTPSPSAEPTATPSAEPTVTPTASPSPSPEVSIPPITVATPEPPRVFLDSTYDPPTGGTVISVPAGGDLQAALDQANPGDIIELEAGATFIGHFKLPNKQGNDWIYIRSSEYSKLPDPGTRVSPWDGYNMPKIVTPDQKPAITTDQGAHNYRFVGIEVTMTNTRTDRITWSLIHLEYLAEDGSSLQTQLSQVPHDIVIDRCYIHGNKTGALLRGIALNSASTSVIDSYISDCHVVGFDNQAIGGWNGPGPYKIVNNYLEAATENVMFGGAASNSPDLVPADIEIRRNHFFKPLSWKIGDPSYGGINWSVKNIFELKNAKRVLVDGNVFENNWAHAQSGFAILFTPRGENPTCSVWHTVEDIIFTNNILLNTDHGMNIMGIDDGFSASTSKRILIKDNLFVGVKGILYQVVSGNSNLIIDHNTAFQGGSIVVSDYQPNTGFVYTNNITPHNSYGVFGSGLGTGNPCLDYYFPGCVFINNVLAGGNPAYYSKYPGNYFPATLNDVGFVDLAGGNYRLSDSSPFKNAGTDGRDLGADIGAIEAATAGVVIEVEPTPEPSPIPSPSPSPTPGPGSVTTFDFGESNKGPNVFQFDYSDGTPGTLYGTDTTGWYMWNDNNIFNDRGNTDAYVAFKFHGTKISLTAEAGPFCGIAACSILDENGNVVVPEQFVDCYAEEGAFPNGKVVYTSPDLPVGIYILKVRVTGEVNPLNPYVNDGNTPPANPYWTVNLFKVTVRYDEHPPSPSPTPTSLPDLDRIEELVEDGYSQGLITHEGIYNSLQAKIKNILKHKSKASNVVNGLNALQNEINAQKGKKIDAEFADALLEYISSLIHLYENGVPPAATLDYGRANAPEARRIFDDITYGNTE